MLKKFRSSLRYKIGAMMLLFSLVPLIVVGSIILSTTTDQLNNFSNRLQAAENSLRSDVVGRNLASAAADTTSDIDGYLLERIADVRRWSEESIVIEAARQGTLSAQQNGLAGLSPAEVKEQLAGNLFVPIDSEIFSEALSFVFLQTERPETPFVEIIITDANGINVLITRPVDKLAHQDTEWWQNARTQGQAGIGVTEVYLDEATGVPVVGLALPIIDPNTKEVLGVIRGLVKLTELQRRISQKAVSNGADIQMFTAEGQLVADTASQHSLDVVLNDAGNVLARGYEPAQEALKAEASGSMVVDTASGRDIVGYALTGGSDFYDAPAQLSGFEGFGWGATVAQPESLALQVLAQLIETGLQFQALPRLLSILFVVVIIAAAVMSLFGAILLSGSITNPLIELSGMAKRVEGGDLEAKVKPRSTDEVGVLAGTFNTMTAGLRERERERDIFGRVVSPEVREKLLRGTLQLGGETLWIAVLFSDIRSFSTISEQMAPEEVVMFLNEYLTEMTDAIREWGGYINNFIGDAVVAVFGAPIDQPDKEWRAVAAALAMRERLVELNKRRADRGEPPIGNGVGISTGEAVAGQIGSLERLMYTVIGDTVNVAARLESLTKDYSEHPILINGPTADALQTRDDLVLKHIGPVQVKGRAEPVDVYAVVEWRKPVDASGK
jgi:class 3 adenylate cyclase